MADKKEWTKEKRIELSEAIFDKAKNMGLAVELNQQRDGGLLSISPDVKNKAASHVEWQVDKFGEVHIAGTLPTNMKSGYNFLIDAKDYETDTIERADLIKLSRKAVKYEGVVASAIEALVEVPTLGGWYIDNVRDEELRKLCYYWAKWFNSMGDENSIESNENQVQNVGGIETFSIRRLWQLYRDGDTVFTENWDFVPVPELAGKSFNLPVSYIDHDVINLTIPEALPKMGVEIIYGEIDEDLRAVLEGGSLTEDQKLLKESIPPDVLQGLKKEVEGKYKLPAEFTTHFSRKNDDYAAWGQPFTVKCFPALAYKHRIRNLDIATIDGMIQRVWIVKVGHDDPDHPLAVPKDERVLLAVSALRKLQTQNFLVWPGADMSTEEFGSSTNNVLSMSDRYQNADQDILFALGIPRLLIDGGGSASAAKDWSQFAKTIAQMERYQIMIGRWATHKLRQIAVENNFKDEFPEFKWTFLKMQDREKAKNIITKLYEDGLLPIRGALNMSGLPADDVIAEMQHEKEINLKDTLPEPNIPFTGPGDREGTPDGDDQTNPESKPSDPDSNRDGK